MQYYLDFFHKEIQPYDGVLFLALLPAEMPHYAEPIFLNPFGRYDEMATKYNVEYIAGGNMLIFFDWDSWWCHPYYL